MTPQAEAATAIEEEDDDDIVEWPCFDGDGWAPKEPHPLGPRPKPVEGQPSPRPRRPRRAPPAAPIAPRSARAGSIYPAEAFIPASVNKHLRPYQREGVEWMWKQRRRMYACHACPACPACAQAWPGGPATPPRGVHACRAAVPLLLLHRCTPAVPIEYRCTPGTRWAVAACWAMTWGWARRCRLTAHGHRRTAAPRRTTPRSTAAPPHRRRIASKPCRRHVRAAGADHRLLDGRARQARQLGGPRAALPTRERRPPASPRGGAHEHALQLAARVPHVGLLAGAAVPRQGARRGDRAGEGGQMRRAAHDLRHDPQKCQGHW